MRTIMCIDDDHVFLKYLEAVLPRGINNLSDDANHQYRFEFIDDPEKALTRIEQMQKGEEELAMVISDENMPGIKGIDCLERIKSIAPEAKKVLVTGNAGLESALKAINNDVLDKYVIKPIKNKEDFIMNLRKLLEVYGIERVVESQRQKLIQADRMASLGTIAAGVAHEINNPLNIALGDIHLIGNDLSDLMKLINLYSKTSLPPTESEKIENFKKEIDLPYIMEHINNKPARCEGAMKRIQDVVKNLRNFSHIDTGEIAAVDINKSIESTLQLIPKKYKLGIGVQTQFETVPIIKCYGRQINQVFMELILNAFQAINGGGILKIKTMLEDGNCVIIKISDTGPGIPEDKIKHIFEPFYTTKPVGEGTGLGLSLCYSIIKKHGGSLTVANNGDEGATFTVKLLKTMS